MPSQIVNLQRKKKNNLKLDKLHKRLLTSLIVLIVLLMVSLGAMLILKRTIVHSVEKQEANIAELETQVGALKQTEGLYLTLFSRLKTILKFRQQQSFIAELPEILYTAVSPYGSLTDISVNEGQFKLGIDTGRAQDVKLVIQALNSAVAGLEIEPKIIVNNTEIDENGNHALSLTVSYNQERSQIDLQEPANNGAETETETGI